MVFVFLLVVAGAVAVTWRSPKWYRSEVQLLVKPSGQIASPVETRGAMRDEVVLYISTLRSLISSDHVLGSALKRLEKGSNPPNLRKGADPDSLDQWIKDVNAWEQTVKEYVSTHTEEIATLRDRLTVVTPGGPDATFTQILTVQVTWPEERGEAADLGLDPAEHAVDKAKKLADNIVAAYEQRAAELEWERSTAAAAFLSDKALAAAEIERSKTKAAYTKFITEQAREDLVDMQHLSGRGGGFGTGKASLATSYAGELTRIEESIAGLESIRNALQTQLNQPDDDAIAVPDSIMTANQSVRALETKILGLKLEINGLTPRYTEDYKELQTARAELASARKEFRIELKKQLTRAQQDIDSLSAKQKMIKGRVDAERVRLKELGALMAEWESLAADKEDAQLRYKNERDRLSEAMTAKLSHVSILLTILGEASQPDPGKPVKPIFLVNLILAIAGGLILSLIYAFSADHFDHSLKGVDDAERYLGVPVLISVPKLGRRIIRAKRGV